jgi:hypothetical protein
LLANALVQVFAVVIELLYALVTHRAVFGSMAARLNVAQVTASILDDVRVLGSIELGHHFSCAYFSEFNVGRIDKERRNVSNDMNDDKDAKRRVERQLNDRLERRNYDDISSKNEHEKCYPSNNLQGMER